MSPTAMIILGFSVIFLATTAGSAIVWFFKRDISEKVNTLFLGFASGIMVAASVWSLIIPSIDGAESWGKWNFVPALIGFLLGGLFLVLLDHVVPHFHKGTNEEEGPRSSLKKSTKMFLAVTIHNIPEGLAVGFAFGAAAAMGEYSAYVSALALAIGIAIQNFPEGAAVALPMKSVTQSRGKPFCSERQAVRWNPCLQSSVSFSLLRLRCCSRGFWRSLRAQWYLSWRKILFRIRIFPRIRISEHGAL